MIGHSAVLAVVVRAASLRNAVHSVLRRAALPSEALDPGYFASWAGRECVECAAAQVADANQAGQARVAGTEGCQGPLLSSKQRAGSGWTGAGRQGTRTIGALRA
jgi:hypothetical protein